MALNRGDIVVVATKGAYTGKPRPSVVVQADRFNPTHGSVTVCPITSECHDASLFRIPLPPGVRTGLHLASQVMVDKIITVPRSSVTKTVGRCDDDEITLVDDALRRWLDLE